MQRGSISDPRFLLKNVIWGTIKPVTLMEAQCAQNNLLFIFLAREQSWFDNIFKLRNNIVNWITMTRKSGEHLRTTYENTGQLFRCY